MASFLRVADRPFPTLPQDRRSGKNTIVFREAPSACGGRFRSPPGPS
jgi:hypothetical protein